VAHVHLLDLTVRIVLKGISDRRLRATFDLFPSRLRDFWHFFVLKLPNKLSRIDVTCLLHLLTWHEPISSWHLSSSDYAMCMCWCGLLTWSTMFSCWRGLPHILNDMVFHTSLLTWYVDVDLPYILADVVCWHGLPHVLVDVVCWCGILMWSAMCPCWRALLTNNPDPMIIVYPLDPMVLTHFGFWASVNSTFKFPILLKWDSPKNNLLATFDLNQMLFVDHVLRSMARYIYDVSLLAYPILPLRMIWRLTNILVIKISYLSPCLSCPST